MNEVLAQSIGTCRRTFLAVRYRTTISYIALAHLLLYFTAYTNQVPLPPKVKHQPVKSQKKPTMKRTSIAHISLYFSREASKTLIRHTSPSRLPWIIRRLEQPSIQMLDNNMTGTPALILICNIIPHRLQIRHRRITEPSNPQIRRRDFEVRCPRELIVPSGLVHRFVGGHVLVEVVVQILQCCSYDARAAGGTGGHDELAGMEVLGN